MVWMMVWKGLLGISSRLMICFLIPILGQIVDGCSGEFKCKETKMRGACEARKMGYMS